MVRHRRRNAGHVEIVPGAPISDQDVRVDERRLDVLRKGLPLRLGQFRHEIGDHHVEAGKDRVPAGDAMQLAAGHIGDFGASRRVVGMDAGAVQSNANMMFRLVKRRVVEARCDNVFHGAARG